MSPKSQNLSPKELLVELGAPWAAQLFTQLQTETAAARFGFRVQGFRGLVFRVLGFRV